MLWLIQKMKNESAFDEIIRLLNKYEIDYQIVKALSFSNKIVNPNTVLSGQDISEISELEIDNKQKIFTIGSYTLAKIAKEKNWTPGSFINDNFDLKSWKNGWGEDNLLNGNALIDTVENISSIDMPKFFARPLHDTKSFSGTVFDKEEFLYWREKLLNTESKEEIPIIFENFSWFSKIQTNVKNSIKKIQGHEVLENSIAHYKPNTKTIHIFNGIFNPTIKNEQFQTSYAKLTASVSSTNFIVNCLA